MLVWVRGLAAGSSLCEGSDIPGGAGDTRRGRTNWQLFATGFGSGRRWGRRAGSVRDDGFEALCLEDLRAGAAEGAELLGSKGVDEQPADGGDVAGGGLDDLLPAGLGEDGVDGAAVARGRLAADPALGLQAADHVAQPGHGAARHRRELAHPQRAIRGLGQAGQHHVVEVADARVLLELGVEERREAEEQPDERPPRRLLVIGEPFHGRYYTRPC